MADVRSAPAAPALPDEPEAPPNYAEVSSSNNNTDPPPLPNYPEVSSSSNNADHHPPPPPPYSPSAPERVAGSDADISSGGGPVLLFPVFFSVFRDAARYHGGRQRHFYLGATEETPLFAVSVHADDTPPRMALHEGPSPASPIVVTARGTGSRIEVTMVRAAEAETMVVESIWARFHRVYRFAVALPEEEQPRRAGSAGPGYHRPEEFEWRHSGGEAIRALGTGMQGWKLVRLARRGRAQVVVQLSVDGSEERVLSVPGRYTSSDGCEVVALWAPRREQVGRLGNFKFVESGRIGCSGNGAGAAEVGLGSRWRVLAVTTMLVMWEKGRRSLY